MSSIICKNSNNNNYALVILTINITHKPFKKKCVLVSLFILAQFQTRNFDRIQPHLQLFWSLWSLFSAREFFHHFNHIAFSNALLRSCDGPHEIVACRDELLFQIDGFVVPPDQLFKKIKKRYFICML